LPLQNNLPESTILDAVVTRRYWFSTKSIIAIRWILSRLKAAEFRAEGSGRFINDVFVSRPLDKPGNFPGRRWVYGFHASLRF
jgi:hypothetical protein